MKLNNIILRGKASDVPEGGSDPKPPAEAPAAAESSAPAETKTEEPTAPTSSKSLPATAD